MLKNEIERYETIIIETSVKIIVYKISSKFAEYYALASFQNNDGVFQKSDGSAKPVEKAKIECEIAVQLDVILNRQTPLQIVNGLNIVSIKSLYETVLTPTFGRG